MTAPESDVCFVPAVVLRVDIEQREELESMLRFMDSNPRNSLVLRAANLIYDILLLVTQDIPAGMDAVEEGCSRAIVHYIVMLAPHYIEILLQLWQQMRDKRGKLHKRADDDGVYLDCINSSKLMPNQQGDRDMKSLTLGNFTRDQICALFLDGSHESGITSVSSIFIDCGESNAKESDEDCIAEDDSSFDEYGTSLEVSLNDSHWSTPSEEQRRPHTDDCAGISELKLEFRLDAGRNSGTRDAIYFSFDGFPKQLVVVNPWAGFHEWITLDIQKMFNKKTILFEDLKQMQLWSHRIDEQRDGWGLEGVRLRAKCSGSEITWQLDRYAIMRTWLQRPVYWDKALVWGGEIGPHMWRVYSEMESCSTFKKLELSVFRGPQNVGKSDELELHFRDQEEHHRIVLTRQLGFQDWQTIDIASIFKARVISLDDISRLGIKQIQPRDEDDRGWSISSSCSNSIRELGLNKFKQIDSKPSSTLKLYKSQDQRLYSFWQGDVNPFQDWVLLSDCARFDELKVKLGVSGSPRSNTAESLFISFDPDVNHPREQLLTSYLELDTWYTVKINLQNMFQKKFVHIDDLRLFRVFSRSRGWRPREDWKVTNVYFEGRCADDHSKVYENVQWHGIESWFKGQGQHSLRRHISASKWRLKGGTKDTTQFVQHLTHDGGEF
ncbi:hypothetical protein CP532_6178 [Ophiocordyceps camponoti-leonardi (nom. inval.)]|nr:hypothetical protein CP532_6178 [Ophiocordyceps camponoti-leonardi (nom. inval.)]